MKIRSTRLVWPVVGGVVLAVAGAARAEQRVPLVNPSFEQGGPKATSGLPTGWTTWFGQAARAAGAKCVWETSGGRTGSRCVGLKGCAGTGCVIQHAPVEQGRAYVCSVWAKRTNPKSKCELTIRWAKADKSWAGASSVSEPLPPSIRPGQWARIDVQVTPVEEAAAAVIMLSADQQGPDDACWFDDVELIGLEPGALVISSLGRLHPNLLPVGRPIETPHVAWGRPLAGGKIRVLFLCRTGHSLREPIELAQRFDIDFDYAIGGYEGKGGWYAAENLEIMERLRSGRYDVVVVTGRLEPGTIEWLAGRCRGIVLVAGAGKLPKTARLAPLSTTDGLTRSRESLAEPNPKLIRSGSLGSARVIELVPSGRLSCLTPYVAFDDHLRQGACYWEASLQVVARAILAAAGRTPAAGLTVRVAGGGFTLENAAGGGRLEVVLADQLNVLHPATSQGSANLQNVVLPSSLPHGSVSCLATLRDSEGRVVDFAAARTTYAPPSAIVSLEPDRPFYEAGQKIRVRVKVKGPRKGLTLRGELVDAFGRTHARAEAAAEKEQVQLTLDGSGRLTAFNWLEATLHGEAGRLDTARGYVLVPLDRRKWLEEYQVGTWADSTSPPAYAQSGLGRMARQIGLTEGLQGAPGYLPMLASGLWPISTAYGSVPGFAPQTARETVRRPCLSDPSVREKMAEAAREVARKDLPFRPLFGYLHDETSLVNPGYALDVCSCQFCQQRYRQWLRGKYASVDDLNSRWGTSYCSWDEVGFTPYKNVRGKKSFAPWVMYRSFMDWTWAEGVEWVKKHARQVDPGAMLALANTFGPNPFSGRDYWLLSQANDYWMEYNTETRVALPAGAVRPNYDAVRSFSRAPNHPWVGYRFEEEYVGYSLWFTALSGATGVAPYGELSLAPPHGSWALIWPTLQHTPRGLLYERELRPLREGLGRLLMGTRRAPAQVAILWSQPSMYVAWAMSEQDEHPGFATRANAYRQYFVSRQAMRRSVLAGARQFDYVCEEEILAGKLKEYKALALPAAFALSAAVVDKIEKFAAAGGLVVADMGCGITSEMGTRWTGTSPIEQLFGFRRKVGTLAYAERKVSAPLGPKGQLIELACTGGEEIDPGAGPAMISRCIGKGKAVFLNFAAPYTAELAGLWAELPAIAAMIPRDESSAKADVQYVLLEDGPARYLGVLNHYLEAKGNFRARLKLATTGQVYDVRRSRYLGQGNSIEVDLPPGGCGLYAILPERPERLELRLQQDGQAECRLQGRGGKPVSTRAVLRMEVREPRGTTVEHYGQNLVAAGGRAAACVPFALSDPSGQWTIEVRDVVSGTKATATIARE